MITEQWRGRNFFDVAALHINFETKFDIASRLSTSDSPVFFLNFTQKDFHMVWRNAERFQVGDNGSVKLTFSIDATTSKRIDTDMRVELRH